MSTLHMNIDETLKIRLSLLEIQDKIREQVWALRSNNQRLHSCWIGRSAICANLFSMNLTAKIKLLPKPERADALRCTLELCNTACNDLSTRTWGPNVSDAAFAVDAAALGTSPRL